MLAALAAVGCDSDDSSAADAGARDALFEARLADGVVVLDMLGDEPLYHQTCVNALRLEKRVGDAWEPLHDERPPANQHGGYFVGDEYIPPAWNLGCDAVSCQPFAASEQVARAEEYVKVGVRSRPADAPAGADPAAPVFAAVKLVGQVRVQVVYSRVPQCDAAQHTSVSLTLPGDGICCPVGSTQCSSEGPGGGWAKSLDACPAWNMVYDVAYELDTDAHGCDVLVENPSECCGCVPVDDAGI